MPGVNKEKKLDPHGEKGAQISTEAKIIQYKDDPSLFLWSPS